MITLENIQNLQPKFSLISKTKLRGNNSRPRYRLDKKLDIKLSNGDKITIPIGFVWDLSTVPRLFWSLLPPDGDFELAYLIHDYLWVNKNKFNYSRKFTDDEMLKWSKATNGTKKISLRNIDNYARYIGVRLFGWLVWKGYIKLNK